MLKIPRIYYYPTPNCWKIAIALEEMKESYYLTIININRGDQHKPDYLAISPNGRVPAIVDPLGPDDKPISIFESGAILLYLSRKYGKFGGETERERIRIEQWLMWQMGGVGPMAGQAHHFIKFAPLQFGVDDLKYSQNRYRNEVARLYGVLDKQLADNEYVAGNYSIADMAIWPWASLWEGQEQNIDDFPHMKAWIERVGNREGVKKGRELGEEIRQLDEQARAEKLAQLSM